METANGNKNGHRASGGRLKFDEFELDPANRTLLRDGVNAPITGKVFDLLLVLSINPGRLLEKDELIERVWPGTFVEEGNLARNISTLRKALGDESKPHKFIETVPGRGYRFVADVIRGENGTEIVSVGSMVDNFELARTEPGDAGPARESVVERIRNGLLAKPWFAVLAILCMAGVVLIAFRSQGSRPRQIDLVSYDRAHRAKLTQDGSVYGGFISPDGRYLAFTRITANNEKALSLRQIATGSVVDLRPPILDVSYWAAAFSPDSEFLYYIAQEGNSGLGTIYRIPLLGGIPRPLVARANGGLAVSPDGRRLAFVRIDREKGGSSMIVADSDGSNERFISSCEVDSGYFSLDWSPDGTGLLYAFRHHGNDHDQWYIAEISADGGPERRFGEPTDTPIYGAKWLPDRSGMIVNAVDEATRQPQIYSVSYPDGAKRRITNDLNSYFGFSMTADARTMVLPQTNSNRQIWEIADGQASAPTQLTYGNETHYESVSWIGNDYIVFDQDENSSFDNYNVWRMRPDGSERVQLTFGSDDNTQPSVSPDGRTIVFVSRRSGKRQVWRMNTDGTDLRQLTDLPFAIFNPRFSSDGRSVYFETFEAANKHVRRISVDGGDAELVVERPIQVWDVSHDGSQIVFSSVDRSSQTERIWIRRIGDAPASDFTFAVSPETWVKWSPDGKSLFYNSGADGVQNVWKASLDGSLPRPVTNFKDENVFDCAWSQDGTHSACIRQAISYDALMIRFE